jgi:hypothetical protein
MGGKSAVCLFLHSTSAGRSLALAGLRAVQAIEALDV